MLDVAARHCPEHHRKIAVFLFWCIAHIAWNKYLIIEYKTIWPIHCAKKRSKTSCQIWWSLCFKTCNQFYSCTAYVLYNSHCVRLKLSRLWVLSFIKLVYSQVVCYSSVKAAIHFSFINHRETEEVEIYGKKERVLNKSGSNYTVHISVLFLDFFSNEVTKGLRNFLNYY